MRLGLPADWLGELPGKRIVGADTYATIVFVVVSVGAAVHPPWFQWPALAVSLVLFSVGMIVMWIAFLRAVNRSREVAIGIGGLYFGAGSAPRRVQRWLNGLLLAQVGAGIATAAIRPFTSLAFGTLVPLFGVGMTGLWCARYGEFGPTGNRGEPSSEP